MVVQGEERWRRLRKRHMASCMRSWMQRKGKRICTDWPDRAGKDVLQVRVIKDADGNVLTSEESMLRRWMEYFEELMNEENERDRRLEEVEIVN